MQSSGEKADQRVSKRGVDVRLSTAAEEIQEDQVKFSNGESIRTRTVVWCAGTRPLDFVLQLGLSMIQGGIVVDATLCVPGRDDVFAFGDSAAVPDLTRPGELCAQTGQHDTVNITSKPSATFHPLHHSVAA